MGHSSVGEAIKALTRQKKNGLLLLHVNEYVAYYSSSSDTDLSATTPGDDNHRAQHIPWQLLSRHGLQRPGKSRTNRLFPAKTSTAVGTKKNPRDTLHPQHQVMTYGRNNTEEKVSPPRAIYRSLVDKGSTCCSAPTLAVRRRVDTSEGRAFQRGFPCALPIKRLYIHRCPAASELPRITTSLSPMLSFSVTRL